MSYHNPIKNPPPGGFIYTVNCTYEGEVYMLKEARPHRIWTKNPRHALIFHDTAGAHVCIIAFFKDDAQKKAFVGQMAASSIK